MYVLMIAVLMVVLPLASIAIEWTVVMPVAGLATLAGKWFVFWAVGVRLLVAGVRQSFNPAFTATMIFKSKDPVALVLVRELGFANVAMGTLGVLTLLFPSWLTAGALVGALFLGFAGVCHAFDRERTSIQNVAMISDLFIAFVLTCVLVATAFGHR